RRVVNDACQDSKSIKKDSIVGSALVNETRLAWKSAIACLMIGFALGGGAVLGVRRLADRAGAAHAGPPASGYSTPPPVAAVPALVINGTEPPLPVKICRFERVVVDPAISHNGHKP